MNPNLRRINAGIAYSGIPKKRWARFCRISPSLFSQYIHGDLPMPPEIEEKLRARLKTALQEIMAQDSSAPVQGVDG